MIYWEYLGSRGISGYISYTSPILGLLGDAEKSLNFFRLHDRQFTINYTSGERRKLFSVHQFQKLPLMSSQNFFLCTNFKISRKFRNWCNENWPCTSLQISWEFWNRCTLKPHYFHRNVFQSGFPTFPLESICKFPGNFEIDAMFWSIGNVTLLYYL